MGFVTVCIIRKEQNSRQRKSMKLALSQRRSNNLDLIIKNGFFLSNDATLFQQLFLCTAIILAAIFQGSAGNYPKTLSKNYEVLKWSQSAWHSLSKYSDLLPDNTSKTFLRYTKDFLSNPALNVGLLCQISTKKVGQIYQEIGKTLGSIKV